MTAIGATGVTDMIGMRDEAPMPDPFGGYPRTAEQAPPIGAVAAPAGPARLVARHDDVTLFLIGPRFVSDPANIPGTHVRGPGQAVLRAAEKRASLAIAKNPQIRTEIANYPQGAVDLRPAEPADDLIPALTGARDSDGARLSRTEIITITLMDHGPHRPVVHLIGNGVEAPRTHSGRLALLRRWPDPPPRVGTGLPRCRRATAVACVRHATEGTEIGGVPLRKGERKGAAVSPVPAAAGLGPRGFDHPDRLGTTRATDSAEGPRGTAHTAPGGGPHHRLGAAATALPMGEPRGQAAVGTPPRRFPRAFPDPAPAVHPSDLDRSVNPHRRRPKTLPVRL